MSRWVTCTDCNRILLREHGPTCPECLAKRPPEPPKREPKPKEPDAE